MVAAVMVVRNEPVDRVRRAIDSLALQNDIAGIEVVIAAPAAEHPALRAITATGAVDVIVVVDNPTGDRSTGLNLAIAATDAEFVVRLDARTLLPRDYVSRCVGRLERDHSVGVVGGVQWPEPSSRAPVARATARALRNRWLLGNPAYRRPGAGGPVDTVYLGVFRRGDLLRLGGFDARLLANEDFDLCARYRASGRRVWLEHDTVVGYEARPGLLALFGQYHAFGRSKVRFWRVAGARPSPRQAVAMLGGFVGIGVVAASLGSRRRAVATAVAVLGGLAAVDHLAQPEEHDPRVRAWAIAASATILGGWLSGVARGAANQVMGGVK
jgi:hypothetical protein